MNNMEIWKDILEYPDYQISNMGRLRSTRRYNYLLKRYVYRNKILSPSTNNAGYSQYAIKRKLCLIHRLVANAFIPNPDNLPEVDHIDNCKKNNRADNLQWITHHDNMIKMGKQTRLQRKEKNELTEKKRKFFKKTRVLKKTHNEICIFCDGKKIMSNISKRNPLYKKIMKNEPFDIGPYKGCNMEIYKDIHTFKQYSSESGVECRTSRKLIKIYPNDLQKSGREKKIDKKKKSEAGKKEGETSRLNYGKKVMDETGYIYDSKRQLRKAKEISKSTCNDRIKKGIYKLIETN